MRDERPRDTFHAVDVVSDERVHDGFRNLSIIHYRDGLNADVVRREIVKAPRAVAVVAHDPILDRLVMIRQFRYAAQLSTGRGMTAEIVAGLMEDGENPEQTARRELMEEAGLEAKSLTPLCQFLTTPGLTDELIHLFHAEVDASELTERAGSAVENEVTFPFLVSLDEAFKAAASNDIQNGIVMLGLLWFERHLRQQGTTRHP